MIPITRKELYLNKIVGNNDYSIPEKPISEEEFFFAEILGEAVQAPEPLTRYQMYLAKIAKRDVEIPYPETRLEYFLARAAGMDITVPVPITREEIYWSNYTAIMEFEVENVPPLAYKAIEGTLKNYRIFGNTVNAASVGDRTANLFDKENIQRGAILTGSDYTGLSYPESVVQHAYGINFSINRLCFKRLFTVTGINTISISGDYIFMFVEFPNGMNSGKKSDWYSQNSPLTIEDKTFALIIKHADERAISDAEIKNIELMINSGSTALPYEPYCYRVPVTVTNGTDTETTNIYLDEPLGKSGDDMDYIDYKTQKRYNIDGTSEDITLPAIQTFSGTNTLSVGTEVQPSKVYIKGEKEREYT